METKTEQELRGSIKLDKYQVFLLTSEAYAPLNLFLHSWFVINNKGKISRWEIRHDKSKVDWGHLFLDNQPPFQGLGVLLFSKKYFHKTKLIGLIEGDKNSLAQKVTQFIEKSKESYPYIHKYFLTGPNSNTYTKWVLDSFPEFDIKLSWRFIGKGYKIKQ